MSKKQVVYSSQVKTTGILNFKDLYKFCYNWLVEETGLDVEESLYSEKLKGEKKDIDVKWTGKTKLTDYFAFTMKVTFQINNLEKVEINQGGKKISTNKGAVKVKAKGILEWDYEGKFNKTAFKQFMIAIYDKWIIGSKYEQFEDKIVGECDDFLSQTKAFMDLEGKE